MCGIAGFVAHQGQLADAVTLSRMCERIVHRGPDAHGAFVEREIALGHQRLSIIDLAGGSQPQGNEDGRLQVVFNGEIYNYRALRRDLTAKGHRFSTESDTEVIVHLYEDVGERTPEHLDGMFAFALWDRKHRQLFMARDRFGKKPLYYTTTLRPYRLAFASELKALMALPSFDRRIRPEAVADYLAFGYVPDPHTIFQAVEKVPAGSWVRLNEQGVVRRRYWTLSFAPERNGDFGERAAEIRALAERAVVDRLVADVPLGALLSGGLDSSAVVGIMATQTSQRVRSCSIGFSNKTVDELEYAHLVVERSQTLHHEEIVTPDIFEMLPRLVDQYDEPFGDSSAVPTLYLCRLARRHVTVVLSGEGADELFGGYDRYKLGVIEDAVRRVCPAWFRERIVRPVGALWPKADFLPRPLRFKSMLECVSQTIADGYFTSVTTFRDRALNRVLSPELRQALTGYSPRDDFRARFRGLEHLSALEQMQAVDLQTYLVGDTLVKMDRASMAFSLEVRAPWLDHRLAEAAVTLPASFKVLGTSGKRVFSEAMKPYVPEAIRRRRKQGFVVPIDEWMRTSLKHPFSDIVFRPDMEALLDLGEVRRLWAEHLSGRTNRGTALWYILVLACWQQRHQDARSAPALEAIMAGKR